MTADQPNRDDDDLHFDDEEFVLDDLEFDDEARDGPEDDFDDEGALPVDAQDPSPEPVSARADDDGDEFDIVELGDDDGDWSDNGKEDSLLDEDYDPRVTSDEEEDVLFGVTERGADFDESRTFSEDGGSWGAEEMDPAFMGMPVDGGDAPEELPVKAGEDWLDKDELTAQTDEGFVLDDASFGLSDDDASVDGGDDGESLEDDDEVFALRDEAAADEAAEDGDWGTLEEEDEFALEMRDDARSDTRTEVIHGDEPTYDDEAFAVEEAYDPNETFAEDETGADDPEPVYVDDGKPVATLEELQAQLDAARTQEGWTEVDLATENPLASHGNDAGWEGIDGEVDPDAPIEETGGEGIDYEYGYEDEDYSAYEENYVDNGVEAHGPQLVVTAPKRSKAPIWFSAAALLLVTAGAGTVVWKPELLGLSVAPGAVEVVSVDRPRTSVELPEPVAATSVADPVEGPGTGDPEVDGPGGGTELPVTERPVVVVTDPVTTPGTGDPRVVPGVETPPAVVVDPGTTGTGGVPVAVLPSATIGEDGSEFRPTPDGQVLRELGTRPGAGSHGILAAGDGLLIQDGIQEMGPNGLEELGLSTGDQAFAQLRNGNFFVGRIKAVRAQEVTLRLTAGEVTLVRGELKLLTPLTAREHQVLERAESGYVKLANSNKLRGGVIDDFLPGFILLVDEERANRVVIPLEDVAETATGEERDQVRLDDSGADDAWLRKLVDDAERARAAGQAAAPAGGAGR